MIVARTLLCFLAILVLQAHAADVEFQRDIEPIFAAKCGKCHSQTVRKGELDLLSLAGLQRGGESGELVIGPTLDDSYLWHLIDDGEMPPADQPRLTSEQRETIRRWIDGGASEFPTTEDDPVTQHDVLPVMLLRCAACHGRARQNGGFDARSIASIRRGGNSGPAIVPGDPDASLLIQRIESKACPPRELLLKFFVKRPPTAEVELLRRWIAEGANEFDLRPDVATTQPDSLVTEEDRSHWAFQPPARRSTFQTIDEFLLARLTEKGLSFSPPADRDTLIRRAHLDLIGIPATVEQWQRWRSSEDPDWYGQMIDHLLASPRYGERWGRYWLDLAGYADSEGGISADPIRPVAWKYRDYVIESFNDDKPYDQFLIQQIAGDELIDYENAPQITEAIVENLVATGFLRMGIDQTGSRTMNFVPERLGVISDAITVLGEGLLGMTLGCARCHSHKYDPIPQRDYYRFKAIFQGAMDEHDWLSFKTRTLNMDTAQRKRLVASVNPPLQSRLKKLNNEIKQSQIELQRELLRQHYPDQSAEDREETIAALRIADNNRTLPQRILVEMLQQVELLPDSQQPPSVVSARQKLSRLQREVIEVERQMEPPTTIRAMWDRGQPSPTYLLRRGEHDKPGQWVGAGVPSALTDGRTPFAVEPPFEGKTGRRLAFAKWLTAAQNPLTARVMVNRIWYHHFGSGIVASLENFGAQGDLPSHPQLLDWLAIEFVERGWSIKAMHRLIMNSRAYRQSSRVSEDRLRLDPPNRLLSRMPLRRMNAEAIRDSMLSVAGRLEVTSGGPPDPIDVDHNGLVSVVPTAGGQWRRSVYLQYRRTEIPTLMETFDYPEMGPNCLTRSVSTVSPQSLFLINNDHIRELAASLAERVRHRVHSENERVNSEKTGSLMVSNRNELDPYLVQAVYHLALSRDPSEKEHQLGVESLGSFRAHWHGQPEKALETYCHTILNSASFLYVD